MEMDEKRELRRDAENIQAYYSSKSRHLDIGSVMAEWWHERTHVEMPKDEKLGTDTENSEL